MCGWWWTSGCLECAAFCKLFPSSTIHISQLNCLWILGLWGKLECNWMCHASKYPIETALSVTSFCLHDPFPHFQLTIKCFHTHTQRSAMSPLQDYYSWRSWLHDQHCPGKQDKTLSWEEKATFSFCVCCRLPCVVQWRRNQKQLVSASYATTSAGQTKPFSLILPAFRTYVPNTLSQLPRWGCPFNQDTVLVHCKFIGMQECIRTGNSWNYVI